jgi:ParB-like chromosome segregation protein Spo0J
MELISLPITQLRPAAYNPRVTLRPGDAAWQKLSRSLAEFGLVQPLVWNRRTGNLVAGHQRLEILKRQGKTQVECIVVDLPLEREQALNVALNNRALMSDWHADKLADVIADLKAIPDFDATLTGFSEGDLHDLLLQPDPDFAAGDELGEDSREIVTVTLTVPSEDWPAVEAALNDLVAANASVRLHVRSPPLI